MARILAKPWVVLALLAALLAATACTELSTGLSPLQSTSPLASSILPVPQSTTQAVPFRLEKPVLVGTDIVRGTGPAGIPIVIADVTFMGEGLGVGTIGQDGTFAIEVPALEQNHMIGILIGDLTGTGFEATDFYPQGYWGEGAMSVAQVGFYYDTVMVTVE